MVVGRLRKRASEVSEASESIASDGFDKKLQALVARRTDLEARLTLRDNRDQIIAERDRLRERAALEEARGAGDHSAIFLHEKNLAFHLGGHVNHTIWWKNLSPDGGDKPTGELAAALDDQFGSFDAFRGRWFCH